PRYNRTEQIRIQLVPKTEELAEIVVVGEALAVVRRGDTIQYNAEAFKTFVNDPMERLFQVLPGMRLEDGVLTYLGQPIKRITIDGERLFGNDVSLALENIRAD